MKICPRCGGTGLEPSKDHAADCWACRGRGEIEERFSDDPIAGWEHILEMLATLRGWEEQLEPCEKHEQEHIDILRLLYECSYSAQARLEEARAEA